MQGIVASVHCSSKLIMFFSLPAFLFVCHECFSTCSLAVHMMRWMLFHRARTNNKNIINNRQRVFKTTLTHTRTHTCSFVRKTNDIDKNRARPSRSVFGQWFSNDNGMQGQEHVMCYRFSDHCFNFSCLLSLLFFRCRRRRCRRQHRFVMLAFRFHVCEMIMAT